MQGAGRTDAGVHALGQVAHFDLAKDRDTDTVRDALNAHLRPHPVAVLTAERVGRDFDARRSALRRHYLYRIVNRRPDLALDRGRAWRVPRPLDAAAMHEAAQRLVGKHDFTTFRSTECQAKSPEKTLDRLDVSRAGEEVHITASARSFLHNQVRSMVGSLVLVGEGNWSADDLAARWPRATAPPAARWRRRRGFIWCGWTIDRGGQPKYLSNIRRYTAVSVCKSATGTRSSAWCMVCRPGRIPPPGNSP